MSWSPPWMYRPLGADPSPAGPAFGPQRSPHAADYRIARVAADRVNANLAAGRPFYENAPPEFVNRFRQVARGMWQTLRKHPRILPRAIGFKTSERDELALYIVNKTYYNALRGIRDYRGESALTTWFFRIAFNAAIDETRMYFRTPEGRKVLELGKTEEVAGAGEAAERALAKAEGRAAIEAYHEGQDTDEKRARLVKIGAMLERLATRMNPKTRQPYLDAETIRVLTAVARSGGGISDTAAALGIDVPQASRLVDEAIEKLIRANKLVDALAREADR